MGNTNAYIPVILILALLLLFCCTALLYIMRAEKKKKSEEEQKRKAMHETDENMPVEDNSGSAEFIMIEKEQVHSEPDYVTNDEASFSNLQTITLVHTDTIID